MGWLRPVVEQDKERHGQRLKNVDRGRKNSQILEGFPSVFCFAFLFFSFFYDEDEKKQVKKRKREEIKSQTRLTARVLKEGRLAFLSFFPPLITGEEKMKKMKRD